MRELHYGGRWVSASFSGFRVPGPVEEALPDTREMVELELASMLGAARAIELEIDGKSIQPPWNAYLACRPHVERFHRWFPALRDRVRQFHGPNIPRYQGESITSFTEAAALLCRNRIQWLNSRIDYPDSHQIGIDDVSLEWCGMTLATKEAPYIYEHWPFEAIAFHDLQVGIQLEWSNLSPLLAEPAASQPPKPAPRASAGHRQTGGGKAVTKEDHEDRKRVAERWQEFRRNYKTLNYPRCSWEHFATWAPQKFADIPSDDPHELRRMADAYRKTPKPQRLV